MSEGGGGFGTLLTMLLAIFAYRFLLALAGASPRMPVPAISVVASIPFVVMALVLLVFYKVIEKYIVQPILNIVNFVKDLPEKVWTEIKEFFDGVLKNISDVGKNLGKNIGGAIGLSQEMIDMQCGKCVNLDPDDPMNADRTRCEIRCMMQATMARSTPFVQHTKSAPVQRLAITL